MFGIIFTAVVISVLVLSVLFGFLIGKKHIAAYAWLKLASSVISLIISVPVAVFATKGAIKLLATLALKLPFLKFAADTASSFPITLDAAESLLAMILAPVVMVALFFIVKFIINTVIRIVIKSVRTAKHKNEEGFSKKKLLKREKIGAAGTVCGMLCGVICCAVVMIPLLGTLSVANQAISIVNSFVSVPALQTTEDIISAATDNTASSTIKKFGGEKAYELLTTQRIGSNSTTLSKELDLVLSAANTVNTVKDPNVSKEETSASILKTDAAFRQSALLPTIMGEVLSVANESWSEGNDFFGISKPASENEQLNDIISTAVDHFAASESNDIKNDVSTALRVVAAVAKNEDLTTAKNDPVSLLHNEELSEAIIFEVLSNSHITPLLDRISNSGINYVCNKMGIKAEGVSLHASNVTNVETEAKALSHALSQSLIILDTVNKDEARGSAIIKDIGPVLDTFSNTDTIGADNTGKLLIGILSSDKVCSSIGYSPEDALKLANSINESAITEGYAPMMNSLGNMVEVVQMSSGANTDITVMHEKIETLLADLTPMTAKVIEDSVSPEMLTGNGVPEQSAPEVSNMVSDIFGNLASAKENGMSDEEYKKEAAATTNMINLAVNASKSENKEIFGENGSLGKTPDEVVDDIFDSSVISKTIVDTVYSGEDSEPSVDPLKLNVNLTDNDKDLLVDTLNNKWNEAASNEKSDVEYQKQYIALGAIFNLDLKITDSGITL